MALIFIRRRLAWVEEWAGGDPPGTLPVDWHVRLLETVYGPTEAARLVGSV
jgi:hypothetical protein